MSPEENRRHSKALEADLIPDLDERARAEARNGLRQFDLGMEIVADALEKGANFRLRPSALLALHRTALEGISAYAGNFRPAGIEIEGSKHTPPGAHLVPELVEDMCDYVNDSWQSASPVHLAAYLMWRLNWIHPFVDGNGRTGLRLRGLIFDHATEFWIRRRKLVARYRCGRLRGARNTSRLLSTCHRR
jgi:fido (protein-threonine AMPylation protein)